MFKNLVADKLESGTIIHYEELDKISPTTINTLKNNLLFESNPSFTITYSDIDNEEIDLVFSASVNQNSVDMQWKWYKP